MNLRDYLLDELAHEGAIGSLTLASELALRRRTCEGEWPQADKTAIDRELNAIRTELGRCKYDAALNLWVYVPPVEEKPERAKQKELF